MPSLRVVAERTHLTGVVTQPDRPSGRGHKLTPSPVKAAAMDIGVRVYEPLRLKAFAEEIDGAVDLFVLASYGRILPSALLGVPRLGSLNVHPSLLPKYRGATPIQTALRDGERETGVSLMLMDAGMDTGEIVFQQTVPILPDETYGELHDRLAAIGAQMLGRALDVAANGTLPHRAQDGVASVTAPIRKEDLTIDWSWPAKRIVDHVRAYSPQPAARATLEGETIKILRAHVGENGGVEIDELIAPNRGRMSGEAYLRGRRKG